MTPPETCGWCVEPCGRKYEAHRRLEVVLKTEGSMQTQVVTTLDERKWFCSDRHRREYCFGA